MSSLSTTFPNPPWRGLALLLGVLVVAACLSSPAAAAVGDETAFVFNRLSFLLHGFLVLWVGVGFARLEAGLVRSLHEPEDLIPAARALAREFIDNSSKVSNTVLRHMMWRMMSAPDPIDAHRIDTAGINALATSADAKEGINAFLEKRAPHFPGKVSEDLPEFFPWWKEEAF